MEDDFNFLKFRNYFIFENKHHKHEGSDVGMLLNSKFLVFLFLNTISLLEIGQ